MHHILGNKVLEYDVDDRGVIVDEREIDRTVNSVPTKQNDGFTEQDLIDYVLENLITK